METKQLLGVVLVIVTITVGMTAVVFLSTPPPDDGNNGNVTETTTETTTTTDGGEAPLLILRDVDLLEYNITLPETLLRMIDGTNITVADLKGKLTLIDFFATWCPACEYFNGDLKLLHEEYGDTINIIGLTVNMGDTFEKLDQYVVDHETTWPLGQDYGDDWDDTVADFLGIRYIPTPIIIDEDGILRWVHEGTWRFVEMNEVILDIMG